MPESMGGAEQPMTSCLTLERPGKWRSIGVTLLLLAAALPTAPLLWRTVTSIDAVTAFVGGAFGNALQNSMVVALLVVVVALVLGLPTGVLTALYEFPGRRVLLALTTLPLLIPSFLWAIGWSALAARLGSLATDLISGFTGCLLVLSAGAVPLVLLTAYAATLALSGSQVDAARLAGGEKTVLLYVSRHTATPALLAAGLGGVLTLSDPGPGQIFGLRTAASEILTSFSALYDFPLAGRQCVALAALVLVVAAPLAFFTAPRLASEVMARQARAVRRVRHRGTAGVAVAALSALALTNTIAPLPGLTLPLASDATLLRAWGELSRTAGNTVLYGAGAGGIAAVLGLLLAVCAGRNDRLRTVCLGMLLALFSLPPALTALGLVQLATLAPAWADPLLRSRLTVCAALGLRFFPVAAVIGLRAWGSTSTTWVWAAAVHGVSLTQYLRRVVLPLLLPAGAVALLLVALLATADVGTVLLLHPPGASSLPLAIFTAMANAPEAFVASLCLVYIGGAVGLLAGAWSMTGGQKG
jgi:iron(III) transport system permease protein